MPNRRDHKKEVEKAVMKALYNKPETIDLVPLDQEEDPERLLQLTQQYHEWLCRQSMTTDAIIRYHQGRARGLYRERFKRETLMTRYDKDVADRTYALFVGYEWLMDRFYRKVLDISKCTFAEIAQIRQLICDDIEKLLSSLEGETSFADAPDVTVYPEIA